MRKLLEILSQLIPFVEPYPIWAKALTATWLTLTAVLLAVLLLARPRLPHSPQGTASVETTNPDASTAQRLPSVVPQSVESLDVHPPIDLSETTEADARNRVRSAHGVRLISDVEHEMLFNELPSETCGFAFALSSALEDGNPWFSREASRGNFEAHKHRSGELIIIGFVSKETAARIRNETNATEFLLFTQTWEEAQTLAAIRWKLISSWRARRFRNGFVVDVKFAGTKPTNP